MKLPGASFPLNGTSYIAKSNQSIVFDEYFVFFQELMKIRQSWSRKHVETRTLQKKIFKHNKIQTGFSLSNVTKFVLERVSQERTSLFLCR